jgi:hypothetical protein
LWNIVLLGNNIKSIDLTPVFESWAGDSYSRSQVFIKRETPGKYGTGNIFYQRENERGNILLEIEDDVMLLMDPIYRERVEAENKQGFCNLTQQISWLIGPELARKVYEEEGWIGLKRRLLLLPRDVVFSALAMSELSGLEIQVSELVTIISDNTGFDEDLNNVYSKAVKLLKVQLEKGGPTKSLDIEIMKNTSAAVLIPDILELRKKEIESVVIQPNDRGEYDLRDFANTYYGGLLIAKLGIGWRVSREGLKTLLLALDKLGLSVTLDTQRMKE